MGNCKNMHVLHANHDYDDERIIADADLLYDLCHTKTKETPKNGCF